MPRRFPPLRPAEIPLDRLTYQLTPALVRHLTNVHRQAGAMGAIRFSYYGLKRLQAKADKNRLAVLVDRVRHDVRDDEISHVLRGDLLPPNRRDQMHLIRQVVILSSAARYFGSRGDATTPETCATYLDAARSALDRGDTNWSRFVGRDRERMLEMHRGSITVDEPIRRLYDWIAEDDLVSTEPVLRAAVLYWGLTLLVVGNPTCLPAVDCVVDHELRAGRIDPNGLLVVRADQPGRELMVPDPMPLAEADYEGDLTPVFEFFANGVGMVLEALVRHLGTVQDQEDRLPWMMVRPPDDLDRRVFEIVERLGSARSAQILELLPDPAPPLRTLQRRLQRLVADGLLVKLGARRNAFYRIAERL